VSFFEYLIAIEEPLLARAILGQEKGVPMAEEIHQRLLDHVAHYLSIGGLPEALAKWIETKNPRDSFLAHRALANTYRQDFEKYGEKHELKYLNTLFDQIPHVIAKQFKYREIHGEYQKRELAPCLDLLCRANVVHKIHHSAGNGLPLGAEINLEWFKVIFLDAALCQSMLSLDLSRWFLDPMESFVNRGDVVEAFIGQELL